MSFSFRRKKVIWNKPFSEKVAKRVAKLETPEIEGWIDQSIYAIGRVLSSYQKTRDTTYLDELLLDAEALHAIVDELSKRTPRQK